MNDQIDTPDREPFSVGWALTYVVVVIYLAAFIVALHMITQHFAMG